ncbi:serine hydrolase domain-containing protein [Dethiobacter alkaliphilus]|uniref:serine hydrolase domain-containing protein n=1 Tax=Dethiobacter alkaliphilus TaxID=427926 RepID=UPI00222751FF|nr:serine hydrolase domain-containing protein [Dethiobacter alkaliphilus]MCW3489743.1 beta-lactamase family protein [Dethiobacter alkaliphilus]
MKHAIIAVESMDGSFKWIGAEGIANHDGTPMTTETPFWVASVTKLYIATAILKLHEQGRLSIDDTMASYLPGNLVDGIHRINNVDYADKITIRHLMSHSSGLAEYLEIHRKDEKSLFELVAENHDLSWRTEDIMQIVRDVDTPLFVPQAGIKKKIRYSDTNFQLLIAIIEKVTGQPIHLAFEEMIYRPLGLEQTFHPGTTPERQAAPVANVWYKEDPLNIPQAMHSFGDLNSTAGELLTFMRALIRGEVFENPATAKLMTGEWNQFGFSISPVGPGWPIEYGLGIMRFRYPKFLNPIRPIPEVIGHTGASGSWLFYCPPLDIMLTGNVSQVAATALPFQVVPKLLTMLKPYFA